MSIESELFAISRMPDGLARTVAAESLVSTLETDGPRELLPRALAEVIRSRNFAGDKAQNYVTFARFLRLWDESPELFDEWSKHQLFWEFKWLGAGVSSFWQVSRARAEALLDDMERRFRLEGMGMSAVALARFSWLWGIDDPGADQARIAWLGVPRDEISDCAACTIGSQVDFYLGQQRYREAIELGLTQDKSCVTEPSGTQHSVALAALMSGDAELAASQYRLALSNIGENRKSLAGSRGTGFELLSLGGQFERALRELRQDDARFLSGENLSPGTYFSFLEGLLIGLSANLDRGELATGLRGEGQQTVAELHAWVLEAMRELAGKFDARNGNTSHADRIEAALAAEPTRLTLDLSIRPAGAARPVTAGAPGVENSGAGVAGDASITDPASGEVAADAAVDGSADELFVRAEGLRAQGDLAQASVVYEAAARGFETDGLLVRAGRAFAEAAQAAGVCEDTERAHALFAAGYPLLVAGGVDDQRLAAVLNIWMQTAVAMEDTDGVAAAARVLIERLEAPMDDEGLAEDLALRRSAGRRFALGIVRTVVARTLTATGRPRDLAQFDQAADEWILAGKQAAEVGEITDAAIAFWQGARAFRTLRKTDEAIYWFESALEGTALVHNKKIQAKVADEFIPYLRDLGMSERADAVVEHLRRAG